ncbi:uncharacterized protein EAF01_006811 [Botrytis porri]|uniref:Uncharacterized protein n=1 Tax=Botrytis porri TaxID=87229 RepID=A0A4Z1L1W7_9HELO|nr:uncharacterized protein EAF01_006811 [Botrytis porri]KAF7903762.1 hypothetical protein EAF01_006811 [Botrytis porri]TGO90583.1 hypothetical protein BPOR_0058g00020 [Botrytis porri]
MYSQNTYTPMPENAEDGWPLRLRRLSRSVLSRPSQKPSGSRKAPPHLHDRPILVGNSESELLDILSSTINTTPALNARPVHQHQRQNTLEDPRRFNVLDHKAPQKSVLFRASIFGSLKKRKATRPSTSPNSALATRETPTQCSINRERTSLDMVNNHTSNLYNDSRPATPKPKSKSRDSSPVRAAKSMGRKLSMKFSRKVKKAENEKAENEKAKIMTTENDTEKSISYPIDIKMVIPDPVELHPAVVVETPTSELSFQERPLRSNLSRKDLRRPNTSASTSTSISNSAASTYGIAPLSIKKAYSTSTLRSNQRIATDLPVMEAQVLRSPPPNYHASMDFPMKLDKVPEVDLAQHPALSRVSTSRASQSQPELERYTTSFNKSVSNEFQSEAEFTSSVRPQTRNSNAPRPSMSTTVRPSLDPCGTYEITSENTHDTVAPLLIRKGPDDTTPKRLSSLRRSLSDFKSSRSTPTRSQTQGVDLSEQMGLTPKVERSSSTRSKTYYTLGSTEAAVPGVSRSATVKNAKRNSTLSNRRQSHASIEAPLSVLPSPTSSEPRNSIATIRTVPYEIEFLPIKASPSRVKNAPKPDTLRSQINAPVLIEEKKRAQTPRRSKRPDYLKMFDVPNLMMDCGGYDEYSYSEYTYSEYAPYSTGEMIKRVSMTVTKQCSDSGISRDGEFEKFMENAKKVAREEKPRVMGRDGVVGENIRGMERKRTVWGSLRRRDRYEPKAVRA